ncbi:MAG TPA: type II secretion system protein N [Burkholderiaceae bacterium]|nr:type II secretion system protein N [Burkholderiaceae bacterium]
MLKKLSTVMVHLVGLAVVSAVGAYWIVRIVTPAPSVAPAPMAPPPPRDPDPVLAARMFGKVQAPTEAAPTNLQLVGVFAAGRSSSAAIGVDGKPARVFLIGQEVTNDLKLASVQGDGVELTNSAGVTQTLRVPQRASAQFATSVPAPNYEVQRGVMSAPSVEAPPAPVGGARPPPGRPAAQPLQQAPQPQANASPPPLLPPTSPPMMGQPPPPGAQAQ